MVVRYRDCSPELGMGGVHDVAQYQLDMEIVQQTRFGDEVEVGGVSDGCQNCVNRPWHFIGGLSEGVYN